MSIKRNVRQNLHVFFVVWIYYSFQCQLNIETICSSWSSLLYDMLHFQSEKNIAVELYFLYYFKLNVWIVQVNGMGLGRIGKLNIGQLVLFCIGVRCTNCLNKLGLNPCMAVFYISTLKQCYLSVSMWTYSSQYDYLLVVRHLRLIFLIFAELLKTVDVPIIEFNIFIGATCQRNG